MEGELWAMQNGFMQPYHAAYGDPPYFVKSIVKRFSSQTTKPSKPGRDFTRLSKNFIGVDWDSFEGSYEYQLWVKKWGELLLEFMYPGALGMFFGSARTVHRLAVGLEDAGWEIVDTLIWIYGNGNGLKNRNMGKMLEQAAGREQDEEWELDGDRELGLYDYWKDYGTGFKTAHEPILVVRKPRGKTYAACAEQHGSGGLYVGDAVRGDGGRYPANVILSHTDRCGVLCSADCPVYTLDRQSGTRGSGGCVVETATSSRSKLYGQYGRKDFQGYRDSGGASRFFYTPKVSGAERRVDGDEIPHPTLKPLALIEHLARLMLPPETVTDRRIVVLFAGVFSEILGAKGAGWDTIHGIEQNPDYIEWGQRRLKAFEKPIGTETLRQTTFL
jgi:site-specific DNA-methyltransferase (adenine-specific)